ncbi:MAG: hypothetical protein K2N55_11980 [Lachnospiraceae bacterium]|nr:hypothetical protein [Lachnospiraceae bacterium]
MLIKKLPSRPQGEQDRMAILGATRHGCRRLRPVRIETHKYILLVKSDLKTRLAKMKYAPPTDTIAFPNLTPPYPAPLAV